MEKIPIKTKYELNSNLYELIEGSKSKLETRALNKDVKFSDCPCPCPPIAREVIYVTFSPVF